MLRSGGFRGGLPEARARGNRRLWFGKCEGDVMQGQLAQMMARFAQQGKVAWIGLRGARLVGMDAVERVAVTNSGLVGDHGRVGKRAVTLVQAEHLVAIGGYLGRSAVAPEVLRRNLVVEGLNLSALKGRQVRIGTAVLEITTVCAPCSRMETALGAGGYAAMRGHGGWCASVILEGEIALGDAVTPL
ncbi:MAG: MOSC domain-containing protein YiiM [Dinoroseobacter sp.]|jgi:MOSC domain-containing protein YiiM